jgi:hypothetical protein
VPARALRDIKQQAACDMQSRGGSELFSHVKPFTVTCALWVHKVAAEGHVMTQPAKRIPTWLTIDVLVIVISLAIIAIGIGIGIAP